MALQRLKRRKGIKIRDFGESIVNYNEGIEANLRPEDITAGDYEDRSRREMWWPHGNCEDAGESSKVSLLARNVEGYQKLRENLPFLSKLQAESSSISGSAATYCSTNFEVAYDFDGLCYKLASDQGRF